jgi:hypothetical protein
VNDPLSDNGGAILMGLIALSMGFVVLCVASYFRIQRARPRRKYRPF